MPDVSLKLDDLASLPTDNSNSSRQQRRLVSTISSGTQKVSGTSSRQCCLHFLLSPRSFHATAFGDAHYLSEIAFRRNKLLPPHHDVRAHIEPTDSDISIKASLAFRSIGYRAEPLADFKSLGVPFDIESGSVANDGAGRVLRSKTYDENNEDLKNLNIDPQTKIKSAVRIAASNVVSTSSTTFPALYVAGWLKTGPTGVIATTMYDSFAVGDAITADWELHKRRQENITRTGAKNDPASVKRLLHEKGIRAVSWRDWKVIDAAERERGKVLGKPRDKFLSKNDMLHLLDCK